MNIRAVCRNFCVPIYKMYSNNCKDTANAVQTGESLLGRKVLRHEESDTQELL